MNDNINEKVFTNSDKTLLLTISKDNLSAYLTIEDNCNLIDEKEISSLLSSAGIKNGFEEANEYNCNNETTKEIGKPFLIALASTKVTKLEISYNINPESCININELYGMDDLLHFEKVLKNQPLAEIPVGYKQKSRIDIFGNEIFSGQEFQLDLKDILGDNAYFSAETNQILSSEEGYPYIDHEKICVKSSFIPQNICNIVKTIYGDTKFDGVISNSNLEIFGNLWVEGDIIDCNNGGIIVHGDVTFDNAENSKIVASGKITINKNAGNSLIFANGAIEAGEFSSISGGIIQSGTSVEVFSIGNHTSTITEIEIAIAPFIKEQIRITRNKLTQARSDLEVDEILISSLISKLKELHSEFDIEIKKSHNIDSLQITIKEKVYPNLKIRILKDVLDISEEKNNIEILVSDRGLEINEVDRL